MNDSNPLDIQDKYIDIQDQNHCSIQLEFFLNDFLKIRCLIDIELDYKNGIKIKPTEEFNTSNNEFISIHKIKYLYFISECSKITLKISSIIQPLKDSICNFQKEYPYNDYQPFLNQLDNFNQINEISNQLTNFHF